MATTYSYRIITLLPNDNYSYRIITLLPNGNYSYRIIKISFSKEGIMGKISYDCSRVYESAVNGPMRAYLRLFLQIWREKGIRQ